MKNYLFVFTFILAICIVALTVFSPVIISFWYGNPLWLFLYFAVWAAVALEVFFFAALLSIIDNLLN